MWCPHHWCGMGTPTKKTSDSISLMIPSIIRETLFREYLLWPNKDFWNPTYLYTVAVICSSMVFTAVICSSMHCYTYAWKCKCESQSSLHTESVNRKDYLPRGICNLSLQVCNPQLLNLHEYVLGCGVPIIDAIRAHTPQNMFASDDKKTDATLDKLWNTLPRISTLAQARF